MKLVIVDYGMGNLRSVQRMFSQLGVVAEVSHKSDVINQADKLVLPGVGHFQQGMRALEERNILATLNQKVLEHKTPILGICLGMQLMTKFSEEGNVTGLGWVDANVVRFQMTDPLRYKVPHVGWNNTEQQKESKLLDGISKEALYYFVHSYYVTCKNNDDILTTTDYEMTFTSSLEKGNIYGTQFHPEKSHDWGKQLLTNFIAL